MEPRLRRMSVLITDAAGEKREVLRLSNVAAFELVPFEQKKEKMVGNILVRMRFALVDTWSVQLKMRTRELTDEVGGRMLLEAIDKYEAYTREYVQTWRKKTH